MWKTTGTHLLMFGGAALLAACSDGATEPMPLPRPSASIALNAGSFNGCMQAQRAGLAGGAPVSVGYSDPGRLQTVVVTATFRPPTSDFSFVTDQMRFPMGSAYYGAQCLNDAYNFFAAETLTVAADPELAAPAGVEESWWNTLTPRERAAVLALAQRIQDLFPGSYPQGRGQIINEVIKPKIEAAKRNAKLRSNDLQLGSQTELMYGAVYGCMLYNSFARDPESPLQNDEAKDLAGQLVRAWAESFYATAPAMALVVAANGTHAAAIAHTYPTDDCAGSMLQRVGNGIRLDLGFTPRGPGNGGGGYTPPQQDPDALPPGWMPYRSHSR
jgi:hypothetical protein